MSQNERAEDQDVVVHAGPLSAIYEGASLRYIRLRGREVLRRIYVALRDEEWRTIPARLSYSTFEIGPDSFRIEFEAEHKTDKVHFTWTGAILGTADGRMEWTFSGEAHQPFLRNRIGLCILHPMGTCAGQMATIEHADGSFEQSLFPILISPDLPFVNVRAIAYDVAPRVRAVIRVEGDIFETEDQRNWSDYSYKTYSTPSALPRPVRVEPGQPIVQKVVLSLQGDVSALPPAEREEPVVLHVDRSQRYAMPSLGVCYAGGPVNPHWDYLRVNLCSGERVQPLREAAALGIPLEVALFTDNPETDFPAWNGELQALQGAIGRYLVFAADGKITTPAIAAAARRLLPAGAPIGGGTNSHFVEVNCKREAVPVLDFVSWAIDPHVHARDGRTVFENLQGQGAMGVSAKVFAADKPLHLSTIELPLDPYEAAWATASLSTLAQAGAASIVYSRDTPFLAAILATKPLGVYAAHSSDPLRAGLLALETGNGVAVFATNFLNESQMLVFEGREFTLASYECRRLE